ncbi:MAG: sigma-70 family RNA polymerase sigma factor [Ruminococcus sp.]|nr:sigma-70 family RNA polymerase sigma factor [Ruminococcus sp.]
MLGTYLILIDSQDGREKFTAVYELYGKLMFKTAALILHNESIAKETLQDCFLKIAENISIFPEVPSKRAKALAVIMARNKAVDNLKREHTEKIVPIAEDEPVSKDLTDEIMSDIGYKNLVEEIMSLDDIYSDILSLRLIYEYTVEEISSLLGIPESTVRSRIYRGRKILKEKLEGIYNER